MLAAFFRPSSHHPFLSSVSLSNVSWPELLRHASVELLLPSLTAQVRFLGLAGSIPDEVLQCLDGAEALNAERNSLFIGEAVHAAKLLNRIGIRPVVLKGLAYLMAGVYPNLGSRYLADIDFLLPAAEISLAVGQLRAHGYRENASDLLSGLRHHHPGMGRSGLPQIEIHNRVGLGVCDRLLPACAILDGAKPFTLDGARFLIPSPTHLVSHLILHSQLAHPYSQRIFPPLRAQYDLARLQARFGQDIDWISLAQAFSRAGESSTLALHLLQAHHDIGFKIPESLSGATSGSVPDFGFFNRIRWRRRLLLNRHPWIRSVDPIYVSMSLLSRRIRLLPALLSQPTSWVPLVRRLTRVEFYSNLFNDFH
jgi:hypothetical protein